MEKMLLPSENNIHLPAAVILRSATIHLPASFTKKPPADDYFLPSAKDFLPSAKGFPKFIGELGCFWMHPAFVMGVMFPGARYRRF